MGKQIIVENNNHLKNIIENILFEEHGISKNQINENWIKNLIKRISTLFRDERAVEKNFSVVRVKNLQGVAHPDLYALWQMNKIPTKVETGVLMNKLAVKHTNEMMQVLQNIRESQSVAPKWLNLHNLNQDVTQIIFELNTSRGGSFNLNRLLSDTWHAREELRAARQTIKNNLNLIKQNELAKYFDIFTNEEQIIAQFQKELESIVLSKIKKPSPSSVTPKPSQH